MLYFDHALSTPPAEGVIEKMAPYFQIHWHSPAAPYTIGEPLYKAVEQAKDRVGQLLNADPEDHLIFTSSGAEAINQVVLGVYIDETRKNGKHHFLTTALSEAPSILAMTRLQNEMDCRFDMIRVDEKGQLTKKALIESLTPRTILISLSVGCGMTGIFQGLDGIAELCRERGVLLHVDVSHLLGKGDCRIDADFITFNGEQIGAPRGTGGLLIKGNRELSPLIVGGNEQEGMRGGSFNLPAVVGLGEAAWLAHENRDHVAFETARLRSLFEKRVQALMPDVAIVHDKELRLPHITCLLFPGIKSEALAFYLAKEQMFASMGGGNFQQLHFLLKALEVPNSHCGLSFSFSPEIGEEELLKAAKLLFESVTKLKRYSEQI